MSGTCVDGQDGEQSGQGEVQAGDAGGDQRAKQRASGSAGDPVQVHEYLQPQDSSAGPGPGLLRDGERICLIGEGEGAVGLAGDAPYPVQGNDSV
jgi:hypothetical protein